MFAEALSYPVRRGGWVMIVTGAIFAVLLDIGKLAPLFGLAAAIFSAGYFAAFYLEIVSTTMVGRDNVPDWPDFASFWDDIFAPFVRVVGLVLLCFSPLIVLILVSNHQASWFPAAHWSAVGFGCFYFPMAVLASQAFGSLFAALPHIVLPAIFRTLPNYFFAAGGLVLAYVAAAHAENLARHIPYVGWFFAAAVSLYAMMFQGRLIGLIYYEKRDALGWYEDRTLDPFAPILNRPGSESGAAPPEEIPSARDIDVILQEFAHRHPDVPIEQLQVPHPGTDDDGLWFFTLPDGRQVQIESTSGMCPFLVETSFNDHRLTGDTVESVLTAIESELELPCE